MDGSRSVKFKGLLQALLRHGVDFFVVGGVAAQLEGAPIVTFDLDIMYDKTPENLERLLRALLLTELGALDVLSQIGAGWTFQDLADRTLLYELGEDRIRVLELSAVIESKEQANRDKDRAALPLLRQTLALKTGLRPNEES